MLSFVLSDSDGPGADPAEDGLSTDNDMRRAQRRTARRADPRRIQQDKKAGSNSPRDHRTRMEVSALRRAAEPTPLDNFSYLERRRSRLIGRRKFTF
jgi:hypothetical protein